MTTELWFHERMEGFFAAGEKDPETGAAKGEALGTRLAFEVTIYTEDLDRFLADPKHTAKVTGFYAGNVAPFFTEPQVAIDSGSFNFMSRVPDFAPDPSLRSGVRATDFAPDPSLRSGVRATPGKERLMEHHHSFKVGGRPYRLDGAKVLEHHPLTWDEWRQLTTMYTTITDATTNEVVAAGVLQFPAKDTFKLIRSFEARGDDSPVVAKSKFFACFLGEEAEVLLADLLPYDPKARRRALARSHAQVKDAYDVVVVGSGYGGGVAAARLAGRGKSIAVLERGKEWRAGQFPEDAVEVAEALRTAANPLGLYELHFDRGMDALVGNGLGGTSLINASTLLRADPRVMRSGAWPKALPDLEPYYARALAMLRPQRHPSAPLKAHVFAQAAGATPSKPTVELAPIAVTFAPTTRDDTGVAQPACNGCGGCVTGCNVGSKNTVDMNYIAYAEKKGAEIYTCLEVLTIERAGGGWTLHCRDHESSRDVDVRAKQVVLAAGTFGTFGILARSKKAYGVAVSDALGTGFSGNGDILGFAYDAPARTQVGDGPTITTVARYDGFIIEEGGIPQALMPLVRTALPLARSFEGIDTHKTLAGKLGAWIRTQADVLGFATAGAMSRTLLFFGMGFEDKPGRLYLRDDGSVGIDWKDAANEPFCKKIDDEMLAITREVQGVYLDNPLSRQFLGSSLITAHPIGGCRMADDASKGVVNAKGEVFGYEGSLLVADGSILPTALGANPALTIAALAEHVVEGIA
jgi:choline dehydrogenase-like flavoprotein